MKNILIIFILCLGSSCISNKKITSTKYKTEKLNASNGYYTLDVNFIKTRQITPGQLQELKTYISEAVFIQKKEIPETTQKKSIFIVENGVAVDVEKFRINRKSYEEGFKGDIKKHEEITFLEEKNKVFVFESQKGIWLHFSPGNKDILTLRKISNQVGVYSNSTFPHTYIQYRYEERKEEVSDF